MSETMRIVLVDDHPLFREGVAYTLAAQADMSVVAQGESAEEALRLAETHAPDVLLLDLNIPGGGGIAAARAVAAAVPATRIIMLTASVDEDDLAAAMGHLGQVRHPTVTDTIHSTLKRIRANGKAAGIFCAQPEQAAGWHDSGASFLALGADTALLRNAALQLRQRVMPDR